MSRSACLAAASALAFAVLNVGVATAQSDVRQRALRMIPVGPMSSQTGVTRVVFSSPSLASSPINVSSGTEETVRAADAPAAGVLANGNQAAAEAEKPTNAQAQGEANAAKPVTRSVAEQKPSFETKAADRSVAASRVGGEAKAGAVIGGRQLPRLQSERPNQGRWAAYLQSVERR
jgi:hypothetical protein